MRLNFLTKKTLLIIQQFAANVPNANKLTLCLNKLNIIIDASLALPSQLKDFALNIQAFERPIIKDKFIDASLDNCLAGLIVCCSNEACMIFVNALIKYHKACFNTVPIPFLQYGLFAAIKRNNEAQAIFFISQGASVETITCFDYGSPYKDQRIKMSALEYAYKIQSPLASKLEHYRPLAKLSRIFENHLEETTIEEAMLLFIQFFTLQPQAAFDFIKNLVEKTIEQPEEQRVGVNYLAALVKQLGILITQETRNEFCQQFNNEILPTILLDQDEQIGLHLFATRKEMQDFIKKIDPATSLLKSMEALGNATTPSRMDREEKSPTFPPEDVDHSFEMVPALPVKWKEEETLANVVFDNIIALSEGTLSTAQYEQSIQLIKEIMNFSERLAQIPEMKDNIFSIETLAELKKSSSSIILTIDKVLQISLAGIITSSAAASGTAVGAIQLLNMLLDYHARTFSKQAEFFLQLGLFAAIKEEHFILAKFFMREGADLFQPIDFLETFTPNLYALQKNPSLLSKIKQYYKLIHLEPGNLVEAITEISEFFITHPFLAIQFVQEEMGQFLMAETEWAEVYKRQQLHCFVTQLGLLVKQKNDPDIQQEFEDRILSCLLMMDKDIFITSDDLINFVRQHAAKNSALHPRVDKMANEDTREESGNVIQYPGFFKLNIREEHFQVSPEEDTPTPSISR